MNFIYQIYLMNYFDRCLCCDCDSAELTCNKFKTYFWSIWTSVWTKSGNQLISVMFLYLYLHGFIYMDFGQGLLFQGWKLIEAWNVDSYCLQNSTGYMGILGWGKDRHWKNSCLLSNFWALSLEVFLKYVNMMLFSNLRLFWLFTQYVLLKTTLSCNMIRLPRGVFWCGRLLDKKKKNVFSPKQLQFPLKVFRDFYDWLRTNQSLA